MFIRRLAAGFAFLANACIIALPTLAIVAAEPAHAQELPAGRMVTAPDAAPVTVVAPDDGVVVVQDGEVALPVGDWLTGLANAVKAGVLALLLLLARNLPKGLYDIFRTWRVEQLLQKALDYAENATVGAMKGKVVTVNVGNEVVAKALRYAVENGSGKLIEWAGGENGLIMKLIARIKVADSEALDETVVRRAVSAGLGQPGVTTSAVRPA